MTNQYTPTTDQVRAMYADGEVDGTNQDYAEFDRWLQKVRADTVKEIIQEVRMIPNWGPKDDPLGGEFDLDGESHRRFVLETLLAYGSKFF